MKKIKEIKEAILYFFPVQILLTHLRKNQLLLAFWLLLFSILVSNFGINVGLPYLLLDPEYLNKVSFISMVLIGITFGIYTTAFFLTSYILDAHKFPFLASVKLPLVKYSINNSILPIAFIVIYLVKFHYFQLESGLESAQEVTIQGLGFILGLTFTLVSLFTYLSIAQNKLFYNVASTLDITLKRKKINAVRVVRKINEAQQNRFTIRTYLNSFLSIKKVNEKSILLDKESILKVIDQHHLNATIVEVVLFICIIALGVFKEYSIFQIPAAASGFLLLSFFVMFSGAFTYWFRKWTITGLIIIALGLNLLIKQNIFSSTYKAFGIGYDTTLPYDLSKLESLNSEENYINDKENTLKILNNWRKKFPKDQPPKMIMLCVSGGGQRAALWTTHTLQHIDKSLDGQLMRNTKVITGASGGLIGATYYRELYRLQQEGKIKSTYDSTYSYNIAKDLLNPMIFSIVVNDLFFRYKKFDYAGHEYFKGRGYSFEKYLNKNTGNILNKKVSDYAEEEYNAQIPMLIIAPTIINDGRKLYISTQPVSYMNSIAPERKNTFSPRHKGVDFNALFKNNNADSLKLLSALRMNASFPYISPFIKLPTNPAIEVMDAGLTDNFGTSDALRFVTTFEKWIKENTSGVILLSIRDSETNPAIEQSSEPSLFNDIFNPIGTIFNNWEYIQDFSNDNQIEYVGQQFGDKFNVVTFCFDPQPHRWKKLKNKNVDPKRMEELHDESKASLSWHLTIREKESIMRTIEEDYNQKALQKLKKLLNEN